MKKFLVRMRAEVDETEAHDILVEKIVHAPDKRAAVDAAIKLVRIENPEINHSKIYFWATERRYD